MPNTRDNLKGLLREQTAQMHQYDTILSPENELLPYEFESYSQMEAIDTGRSTNWQTDFLSDMSDFESTSVDDIKQWFQATAKNKLSTNLSNKQDALAEQEAKWLPEMELAQEYLGNLKKLDDIENISNDEAISIFQRNQEIEPQLKEYAKTNPYLQDLFYETGLYHTGKKQVETWLQTIANNLKNENLPQFLTTPSQWLPSNQLKTAISQNALSDDVYKALWDVRSEDNIDDRINKLNDLFRTADAEYKTKTEDLIKINNAIKKGNWYFNPLLLTPEFEDKVKNTKLSILDPESWFYASTNIGSSLSEIEMMGMQYATALIAKQAAKRYPATGLIIAGAEAISNLALSKWYRTQETASEVFDNFKQNITEQAYNKNLDIESTLNDWRKQLTELGYDGDLLSGSEVFDFGLAQGLKSKNSDLENIRQSAYESLQAVRSVNDALSYVDYLQSVPFSYGGKVLWDRSKNLFNGVGKNRVARDYAEALLDGNTTKELDGVIDRFIVKGIDKLTKKLTPADRAFYAQTAKGIGQYGTRIATTAVGETLEEGQQYIVGDFYRKGYYSNMTDAQMSPTWAAGEAGRLGAISALAYLGWDPTGNNLNTDEELTNAMNIGGFISLFMPIAQNVSTAKGLYDEWLNNQHLRNFAAKGYDSAEKDVKMDIFLKGISEGRQNYQYTHDYLDRFLSYKPEGVTDKMIEEDKQMLDELNGYYYNSDIKTNLSQLGIDRGSDNHKQVVKNYIHLNDVVKQAEQDAVNSRGVLKEKLDQIENNPSESFTSAANNLYDQYVKNRKETDEEYKSKLKSVKKRADKKRIEDQFTAELEAQRETFIKSLFHTAVLNNRVETITQLIEDIKNRNATLDDIANQSGVRASTDIFRNIIPTLEMYKKAAELEQKLFNENYQLLKDANNLRYETLNRVKNEEVGNIINQAVRDAYISKRNAYLTGEFRGNSEAMIDTISYSELTPTQKQTIKKEYLKDKHIIDPSSVKESDIEQWFDENEEALKTASKPRFLANVLIQRDLQHTINEENIARQEKIEDGEVLAEENEIEEEVIAAEESVVEEPTSEEEVQSEERIGTPTQHTPEMDSVSEQYDSQQAAIDALAQATGQNADDLSYEDYSEAEVYTPESEPIEDREQIQRELVDGVESGEEESAEQLSVENVNNLTEPQEDIPVPVTEQDNEDLIQQNNIEDTIKQIENQEVPVEPEEDVQQGVTEEPSIEEQKEIETPKKPETHAIPINEPNEQDPISVTEFIADPNQIHIQDDVVVMSPTNTQGDAIVVDPNNIQEELIFEDTYNLGGINSATDAQNSARYASRTKGIDNLDKQKKNLIGSTFFFQPTADQPMVLKANGKDVVFTTKDGKVAKRGTGRQLSENLAIPGWLNSADDVYYIVTDKWISDRRDSIKKNPVADLAVHVVIEKDGVVYVASLRTPQKAQEELTRLHVSQEEITKDLDNLIRLRTKIIQAYCSNYQNDAKLPSTIRKDVKPGNLRISNGQIANQKDGVTPKYRKLTEVGDLQIPSDPYELTDALESGEVEIGYGKGAFAMTDPFSIQKLTGDGPTSSQATGYAGKLYIIPKAHQTPSQRVTPPIMLSEETHDIPGLRTPDSKKEDGSDVLTLVFNSKHQQVRTDVAPSTAEMIYELLTTEIYPDQEVQDWILTLLANNGFKTITDFESRMDLDHYVRKNLMSYVNPDGDTMLVVGMARNNQKTGTEGQHVVKHINTNTITEGTRRQVIFNIAKNIHWNTDKNFMMTRIPDKIVNWVVNSANTLLQQGKFNEDSEIKLLGNDVAFTLADVGYKLENGKIVKSRDESQAPSVLAWMINHGKIKTDLGDHLFRDPFIYSDDVTIQEQARAQEQQVKEATERPIAKKIVTEKPISEQKPKVGEADSKKPIKATPENLAKYGLTLPEQKAPNGFIYAIGFNKETGEASVVATPKGRAKALGLYSRYAGTGKIKAEKAKEWLQKTLGIDADDIILTDGVLRTSSDEKAYAVIRVAFDAVNGQFKPIVALATANGETLNYHEGWHYVSMFLLSEKERKSIHDEYLKRKNIKERPSEVEIDDMLAEEYRDYRSGLKHYVWGYKIQKFFSKLSKFLHLDFLNPSLHMQMFARIDAGEFKKYKPTQERLKEIYQKYDEGFYYYIPGMSMEDQKKIPHIADANTFYNVVESLSYASLTALNIRTKEDLQKGLNLSVLFKQLEDNLNNGFLDEIYEPIATDVLLNREIFEKYIKLYLQELDVDKYITDSRIAEKEDTDRLATETGERSDNVWDQNQGDVSKKDNAAKNAKLFFFSIPETKYVYRQDETTGELVREIEEVTDPIFGLSKPVPFSIAWNLVLENLWNIDNIDDLIKRCAVLGETQPFFSEIHKRLTDKDNPLPEQVLTQLENTIKSSKNSMTTIEISQDTPKFYEGMSDEQKQSETDAAKKRSIWQVLDSDNLRKIQRYPKQWSLSFFASDNIIVNSDGSRSINHVAYEYLQTKVKAINNELTDSLKKGADKTKHYGEAKKYFIELCNAMMIPFDSEAFDYMITNIKSVNKNGEPLSDLQKFRAFWNSDKKGSFKSILSNITAHTKSGNKRNLRQLDRMFTTSNKDAHINLMAAAYGKTHPSPEEFSVTGADGALIYPISENNYMSDQVRWLNQDLHGKKQNILNTAYGKSSLIANNAGEIKLHTLIAVSDKNSDTSRDYFGISPLEDYITKMVLTENDHMVLPTMSDKKTWYSISGIKLLHENMTRLFTSSITDPTTGMVKTIDTIGNRRFSGSAINIFSNYFISELDAVIEYYQNKEFVGKNPEYWRKNYHGKIVNGVVQPGGNGGRFRYFSTITVNNNVIDLNKELDKFERYNTTDNIIKYLNDLKQDLQESETMTQTISNYLFDCINREINSAINQGIVQINKNGDLSNKLIPESVIKKYRELFKNIKTSGEYPLTSKNTDIIYSIFASHVLNTQISIQEVEKCFVGDPAFYKWSTVEMIYKPNDPSFTDRPGKLKDFLEKNPNAKAEDYASYTMITERAIDKIKRLSSVLSTGTDLRTYWGEGEEHSDENDTSYTVLNLKDNEVAIPYYNTLKDVFEMALIRETYSKYYPELSDDELFEKVNPKTKENILKEFSNSEIEFIKKQSKLSAKAYEPGAINQADAAVYMRPAMWRKVMRALGKWNDEIEEAYNIMESNDAWMDNPSLYKKATKLILNVQKMVYMGDTFDSKLGLDIPVFNKMAIFPLFKTIAKADNRHLYDRMNNEELGEIDMLVFESSVKVGLGNAVKVYDDSENTRLNLDELNKPSFTKYAQKGNLPTVKQDIKNLRLQLNTDPHEHMERAMGTQAVKMFLSNILDDRSYGNNKGLSIKGQELKSTIMECINELTYRGYKELRNRFFSKDKNDKWQIDNKKLSEELIKEAQTSGMSQEVIYGLGLDENGEFRMPISALSSRNWIESRIISLVNKLCVDINTKGGAAIQMPDFGFKKTSVVELGDMEISGFGDGKPLSFLRKDGSMEVMLTTNFFRHIVPIEHQSSFGAMRKWLLENEIIGPKAKPIGIGYRIPTQGSSSTFSFVVKDVLPKTMADTIVVPDGFTAMTGSDFDIDKLYIAMLDYENGKEIEWEEGVSVNKQKKGAVINRMLKYQQICISDEKNMAETRASIDTLTSFLKKDVMNDVKPVSVTQTKPGYELLPSFQLGRKIEYTSGKSGIAPFALNSTNHALTQFAHLNMYYSKNNKYNLGSLDAIYGEDGFRILDWLSAMINAHVDVAKDPYIISLNVNQVTYNMTNLLLRGGKGLTTFYFLAQDILKLYAAEQIANKGVYGVDPSITEGQVLNKYYQQYEDDLFIAIQSMPESDQKEQWKKLYNGWLRSRTHRKRAKQFGATLDDRNSIMPDTRKALDLELLKSALRVPQKLRKSSPEFLYQQLLVLKAYSELNQDAKRLASLVKRSQIDTKKFGNNLALQMNFNNSVNTFFSDEEKGFYLTNVETPEGESSGTFALNHYFNSTFLSKKLKYATSLPRAILRNQSLIATKTYENIYNNIMRTFAGEREEDITKYANTNDKEFVTEMNKAIESVVRARIASQIPLFNKSSDELYSMLTGENSMCYRLTQVKQYLLENADEFPFMVDKSTATITNALLKYMQEYPADNETRSLDRIILFNSSMNNDIQTEERLISAFDDLLNSNDEYVRQFAEDLAIYAYLTSYDNPGVNSFFNLVPLSWKIKIGYTDIMKQALSEFANMRGHGGVMIAEKSDNPDIDNYPSVALTIARNLWRNNEIVPQYNINTQDGDQILSYGGTPRTATILSLKGTNKRFIKIGNGENAKLYRKVGRSVIYDIEEDKNLKWTERSIYVLTPKLGVNDNGTKVYEFINSSTKESIFPENALNNDQIIDTETLLGTLDTQEQQLIKSQTKKYDKDSESKYKYMFTQTDNTFIETKIVGNNEDVFIDPLFSEYTPFDNSITDYTGITDDPTMVDTSTLMVEETPISFESEASVFNDMASMLEQTLANIDNTPIIEDTNLFSGMSDDELIAINMQKKRQDEQCKQ